MTDALPSSGTYLGIPLSDPKMAIYKYTTDLKRYPGVKGFVDVKSAPNYFQDAFKFAAQKCGFLIILFPPSLFMEARVRIKMS